MASLAERILRCSAVAARRQASAALRPRQQHGVMRFANASSFGRCACYHAAANVTAGKRARNSSIPATPSSSNSSTASFVQPRRSLFIQTENTPNPNSVKFHPGRVVLPEEHGSGLYCTRGDTESKRSPLARKIFKEMDHITGVFLGRDFITLTRDPDMSWKLLRPMALTVIMDFFAEGLPVVTDKPVASDTTVHEEDDEVIAMIKELIEERIRPSVQDDGGDIFYKGFDRELGIVKLQLAGSCKGCPSSSVTLKQGVETMLMHYIPEVQGVEEVVDDELQAINRKEVNTLEARLAQAGIPFSD